MSEVIDRILVEFKEKVTTNLLPPDPARIIDHFVEEGAVIEHIIPLPPIIETIHAEIHNLVETKLPRLDQMAATPFEGYKSYPKTTEVR